ncbi:MAG: DUF1549 domain-containing protein [Verrucomicrobiaceae bacterium]|nr:DUF1549 domain-containing protein [Verrucomicrobiaceae bacterium]
MSYNRDVRPILAAKCFACHGPDEDKREADLRLDVPGEHFDGKEIIHRITTTDADEVMPPRTSPKPLTRQEKSILKQWIDSGAKYEQHWAFRPITHPVAPTGIDGLIRAELQKHGLQPAPRADATTLIRRLYLDLIGLPPPASLSIPARPHGRSLRCPRRSAPRRSTLWRALGPPLARYGTLRRLEWLPRRWSAPQCLSLPRLGDPGLQ